MAKPNKEILHTDTGILKVQDACIVLVKTEWNSSITDELEKGCIEELKKQKVKKIISLVVPGAFEIPFAIRYYWQNCKKKKRPHAFISLGCVIRGETPHFDQICRAVTDGVLQLNLELPIPSIFGVLTVENEEQAKERAGGKHGHKGREAAMAALKMISSSRSLKK